jgi:hypothetical protein
VKNWKRARKELKRDINSEYNKRKSDLKKKDFENYRSQTGIDFSSCFLE